MAKAAGSLPKAGPLIRVPSSNYTNWDARRRPNLPLRMRAAYRGAVNQWIRSAGIQSATDR